MATKKAVYIKGSQGSKPTPRELIPKPLPAFVQTTDLTMFKGPMGNKKGK